MAVKDHKVIVPNDILLEEVRRLLAEGKEVILLTKGQSMTPFIRGERDSVAMIRKPDVCVGDIVLAKVEGERYVLHRVIKREGERLTLMGDGNIRGHEHCTCDLVAGTVTRIIKPSGREIKPRDGRFWRALLPMRRIIIGVWRRVVKLLGI